MSRIEFSPKERLRKDSKDVDTLFHVNKAIEEVTNALGNAIDRLEQQTESASPQFNGIETLLISHIDHTNLLIEKYQALSTHGNANLRTNQFLQRINKRIIGTCQWLLWSASVVAVIIPQLSSETDIFSCNAQTRNRMHYFGWISLALIVIPQAIKHLHDRLSSIEEKAKQEGNHNRKMHLWAMQTRVKLEAHLKVVETLNSRTRFAFEEKEWEEILDASNRMKESEFLRFKREKKRKKKY